MKAIKVILSINDLNNKIVSTILCKNDWLWPWLEFWLSNFLILFINSCFVNLFKFCICNFNNNFSQRTKLC